MKTKIFIGDMSVDDRGSVSFVNDFDFSMVKRFYQVENHSSNFIRAWHGHKIEGKYVYVASGTILLGVVKIDNWETPSINSNVEKYVLTSLKPRVMWIPPGYANGFKTLTDSTKVIFFSTTSLEDSQGDDFRYPHDYWNIWEIIPR